MCTYLDPCAKFQTLRPTNTRQPYRAVEDGVGFADLIHVLGGDLAAGATIQVGAEIIVRLVQLKPVAAFALLQNRQCGVNDFWPDPVARDDSNFIFGHGSSPPINLVTRAARALRHEAALMWKPTSSLLKRT